MTSARTSRPIGLVLAIATAAFFAVAIWLFPKAQPTIALKQELTRELAIERARAFATAHQLSVQDARVAVRFEQDGETQTYIELEAGGKPAVNAEVKRDDVALFTWIVRFFRPGDPREVRVTLSPSGRVLGFRNVLAAADVRPALDSAQAFARADSVRRSWLGLDGAAWRPVATSTETVQPSGRLDRTITFERSDRKLGAAPLRLDVVVRGDVAGGARPYAKVPEPFLRRYAERRADNDLYAQLAMMFMLVFGVLGIAALIGARKRNAVRWRPALLLGGTIGLGLMLAQLNEIPSSYFGYNTALPQGTFLAQQWLIALLSGVGMGALISVVLAAGEMLTREAFPQHFDWWQTARDAGTRPVALRVLGGYTVAAFGLAYVSVFYLLVERGLGWWSPSGLLDDPNLIATPLPWLSAVANSLQAGVLEEVLFRAIPIALVARAVGNRAWRPYALAASVVLTALVFGFAHANYPSFPAYARGVELFSEAALWAVLYMRVGLITTIVGHFTFDLILFGLFTSAGHALPYRISLAVVVLAVLTPALVVAAKAWRTRGLAADAPDDARFSAWQTFAREVTAEMPVRIASPVRRAGWGVVLLAALAVVINLWPSRHAAEPRFTATRAQAITTADSVLRTLGATPDGWTRLVDASTEAWAKESRFLAELDSTKRIAPRITRTWMHSGAWDVRYVHTAGNVAERTESWEVVLAPDGRPHTWTHVIADSAPAPSLTREQADALARAALVSAGAPAAALSLISATETAKPARRDVMFEFADGSIPMPGNASLRWTATVSGDHVTRIGHRIFLPEAWERLDTSRIATHGAVTSAVVVVMLLIGGVLLVRFMRRVPLVPSLPWPTRTRMLLYVSIAAIIAIALRANEWPSSMHGWDTASPFNRHQWTTVTALFIGALGPLMLWALWLAADTARRRMGVAVRSATARDAWLMGGAMASGPALLDTLGALLFPQRPQPVDTVLDQVIPALGHLTSATTGAVSQVGVAVLAASVFVSVRSTAMRLVMIVLVAIAVGALATGSASTGTSDWIMRAAVDAAAFGALCAIWWRLGGASVEAWFAGALLLEITSALSSAAMAASAEDRLAYVISAIVAVAIGIVVTTRPRSVAPSEVRPVG